LTDTPNAPNDSLKFYWDENAGQHGLTVSVIDANNNPWNNGQPYTKTFTFSVEQPKVESYGYTRDSLLMFGQKTNPNGANTIGFFQSDPGDYFTPAVTTYNFGGTFALMETTNLDWTRTGKNSGAVEVKSDAYVLDPTTSTTSTNNQPLMLRGWSTQVGANQFDVDLEYLANQGPANQSKTPPEPHYLRDNPWTVYCPSSLYPGGDYWTAMGQTWALRTHLMYQPSGGIWVSLARIDWQINGSATFIDTQPAPKTEAYYASANNWNVTWGASTSNVTYTPEIPTWTDQFLNYQNQWYTKRGF